MEAKSKLIKQVFLTMEYGRNNNNTDAATEWFKSKGNAIFAYEDKPNETPKGEFVAIKNATNSDQVLCKVYQNKTNVLDKIKKGSVKWADVNPIDRLRLINKLATEIESNADVICQIEIVTRGLLLKDTKKQVKLLVEYLQYYSAFALKVNKENSAWKPSEILEANVTEKIGLSVFGTILGPSLAAGYNTVILGHELIAPIATYLLELAYKVGIPDSVLRFIPDNDVKDTSYVKISAGSGILVNCYKTPMLVFDNADLDSACDSVIDATWGHHGMLPESLGFLLIQENIFHQFVTKLKNLLKGVKIGPPSDKIVDIAYPVDKKITEKLLKDIKEAEQLGIEVFQPTATSKKFQPTLFIGAKVHTNSVLEDKKTEDLPSGLTIVSFRTIDEAVDLANNSKQGYVVSVWTENVSLANEVAGKLNVNNIWINGHGQFAVDIPIVPRKKSGFGCIGGEDGFNIYWSQRFIDRTGVSNPGSQTSWHKTPKLTKLNLFNKVVDNLLQNKKTWSEVPEKLIEGLPTTIYECVTHENTQNSNSSIPGYIVNSFREPVGLIAIILDEKLENHNVKLIIKSILQGNSVILVTQKYSSFYSELFKFLPNGVVTVISNASLIPRNKCVFVGAELSEEKITCVKNVWQNVGQSSQCKL